VRVAIVNDMGMAVEALRRALAGDPSLEVAWVARDGAEAVAKCAADIPDLVLMDLIMPVMDGVEATRRIMTSSPCAILVVTATVEGNTSRVFDALGHGALDAVDTPVLGGRGGPGGAPGLLTKISNIRKLIDRPSGWSAPIESAAPPPSPPHSTRPPLVAIGCSTGGPAALATVLAQVPAGYPGAVIVVQHLDVTFADGLARWLDEQTEVPVRVAAPGDRPEGGSVLVAASNDHMVLTDAMTLEYTSDPVSNPYRPSVDVLFHTLAAHWPDSGIAVVLTGMGRDGAEGMLALRRRGWRTIAQDRVSSLIWGMPRACAEAGAASEILSLRNIGTRLSVFPKAG